jgi:CheY-like chemotaxis protein
MRQYVRTAFSQAGEALAVSRFILLVEDDEDIRTDVQEMLEISGYPTVTATDGADALRKLEGSPQPALIVLDLMMPVMDGWQLRQALREQPALAEIPIVVLSGAAGVHHEARELGAVGYFTKPFSMRSLLETIERHWPT